MDQAKLEQFKSFVQARPITKITNPFWEYDSESDGIVSKVDGTNKDFDIREWSEVLLAVRTYFVQVYTAFGSEAQVLCLTREDAKKLYPHQIPHLPGYFTVGGQDLIIFVLPQSNSFHITNIDEAFWQTAIIAQGIHPVARIHSHHILDPYQSPTDYATLNSNTLEIVLGHIYAKPLHIGYWLDVRGTEIKTNVWTALQSDTPAAFDIQKIPCGNIRKQASPKLGATRPKERK